MASTATRLGRRRRDRHPFRWASLFLPPRSRWPGSIGNERHCSRDKCRNKALASDQPCRISSGLGGPRRSTSAHELPSQSAGPRCRARDGLRPESSDLHRIPGTAPDRNCIPWGFGALSTVASGTIDINGVAGLVGLGSAIGSSNSFPNVAVIGIESGSEAGTVAPPERGTGDRWSRFFVRTGEVTGLATLTAPQARPASSNSQV